jgi:hypothetical protein
VSIAAFGLSPADWLARPWAANSLFLVPLAVAVIASYVHLRRY